MRSALQFVVNRVQGRTMQGLRSGNNIELRRIRSVADVTRRSLHGRSLRPILGSEDSYVETFGEDFAEATACLGSRKIVRGTNGLLTCVARSQSSGRLDDWSLVTEALEPASEDESSDDELGVIEFHCMACGVAVMSDEHGWLCDEPSCTRGRCVTCHVGGEATPLRCPLHS